MGRRLLYALSLFHVKLWTKQTHKRRRNSDKKAENFVHHVLQHRFFLPRAFVLFTLFFLRAACNVPGIVYAPLRLVPDNDSRQPLRTLKEKQSRSTCLNDAQRGTEKTYDRVAEKFNRIRTNGHLTNQFARSCGTFFIRLHVETPREKTRVSFKTRLPG